MKVAINTITSLNIPAAFNIIATVLFSYALSEVILKTIEPMPIFKPVANLTKPEVKKKITSPSLFLFGAEKTRSATPIVATNNKRQATRTKVHLKLVGLIQATPPNSSVAIIKYRSQENVFIVGDEIARNLTVTNIGDQFILVNYFDETLRFDIERLSKKKLSKKSPKKPSVKKPTSNTQKHQPKQVNNKFTSRIPTEIKIPVSANKKLDNIRYKIKNNPFSLMNVINGTPILRNGKMYGIRVAPGKDKALFKMLKLKRNDIITKINDIALGDGKRLAELMQIAQYARLLNVELERGGEVQNTMLVLP